MTQISQALLLSVLLTVFHSNCLYGEIVKILIQGDTQKIMDPVNEKQDNFIPLMEKVLTDPITREADFILQMGDIVETDKDNSDRPQQYAIAREGWRKIDGKIPYVLNLGNNDNAKEYFEVFDDLPKPFSKTSDGRNFAYKFSAGDVEWLIISVRYHDKGEEKDDEVNWAINLIEANQDRKVIFIKHEVNSDSRIVRQLKNYSNVVFILSGHTQSLHKMLTGQQGNKIGWIRTCHHNANLDSYFRVLLIDTASGIVSSSFYSPQYEKFWHDPTAPYHNCAKSVPWTQNGFDFGVEETEVAIDGNEARFISLEMPCCVVAGSEFKAIAVFENTGATWDGTLQQNKYKLGSENPRGNEDWGEGTGRTNITSTVASGELYQFEINCIAPAGEGYYNFQRRMLQEKIQWFGEFSENRIVSVVPDEVASKPSGQIISDFSQAPVLSAYKGKQYRFEVDAADFLKYSLYSKPGWLNFDSDAGVLSGTPREKDIGFHAVTLDVSSAERSEKFSFILRVFEDSPYTFWEEEYSVSKKTDDDDQDGLQNFWEFALGGNPSVNDVANKRPEWSVDGSDLDITFRRNQSSVIYTVQKSKDLINWFNYIQVDDSYGLVGDTCHISIPGTEKRVFFRLDLSEP